MLNRPRLHTNLEILLEAVEVILGREGVGPEGQPFKGGLDKRTPLKITQREALEAYRDFLLTGVESHKGYFEIPTGIGKTGIFVAITKEAYHIAEQRGVKNFRSVIVVPTTNLLKQTRDEFRKYAPELSGRVGLFGALNRDLGKPVTIITYNSWDSLTTQKRIHHQNTDLLISDEAHRGLSNRRQDNIFESYGDEVPRIAFTATAHFDIGKSVEHSHQNLIYYKSLPEAVRSGELASYIQTQLYVVRVNPVAVNEEFNQLAEKAFDWDLPHRMRMRQEAWNQCVAKVYAEGRDTHTGDFLYENQAAFFVADIAHARRLEQLLNQNPQLQEIARSLGYEGVAVAIHSHMSTRRQEELLTAYKERKYMAVIGDEKFKEGFDHAPLKTIIDYPHGSLVDKAQIIGRGARQWYNEAKDRMEGLTFVDTIVYVGMREPHKDKRERAYALRNSVLASSIIEGTFVVADSKVGRQKKRYIPSHGGHLVFPEDIEVEQYSTLEDVRSIHAEIENMKRDVREGWIPLTDEMRERLRFEIKRTSIGPKALAKSLNDVRKDNLITFIEIKNWTLRQGTVDAEKFISVCEYLAGQPTAKADKKIPFTETDRTTLMNELERTGMQYRDLAAAVNAEHGEDFIDHDHIRYWVNEGQSAPQAKLKAVMDLLKKRPNATAAPKPVPFTKNMATALRTELDRTGVRVDIHQIVNEVHGAGYISSGTISNWFAPGRENVDQEKYSNILACLKALPAKKDGYTLLTGTKIRQLAGEMDRAKIGPAGIADALNKKLKKTYISASTISAWLSSTPNSLVRRAQLNAVKKLLKQKPSRISLDATQKVELRLLMKQANFSLTGLYKELARTGETGFSKGLINGWLDVLNTAEESKYKRLIAFLRSRVPGGAVASHLKF